MRLSAGGMGAGVDVGSKGEQWPGATGSEGTAGCPLPRVLWARFLGMWDHANEKGSQLTSALQ